MQWHVMQDEAPAMSEWSDDELEAIFEVALSDERGWRCPPNLLPAAEQLRERGILERSVEKGRVRYRSSSAFRAKAEALAQHQAGAVEQALWN
jgi:hypothetical protein